MKLRTVTAALALVVTAAGLSGCTTKVGVAATINGQRVTDSDLVSYLTPTATAVQSGVAQPVRSYVLQILIEDRLLSLIAKRLPATGITEKQIQSQITAVLQGHTRKELTTQVAGATGFKPKFDDLFAHVYTLNNIFESLQQQSPAALSSALKGLKFPVSVSSAYGTWNPKTYQLKSGAEDGYPSFMTFAPSAPAIPGS